MKAGYTVAVVGATGAVGTEIIKILEERNFPVKDLILFASPRSVGSGVEFHGEDIPVRGLGRDSFRGVDLGFFAAGTAVSKEYAPLAVGDGCIVIDSSPCFRMDRDVPLVVPEVNPHRIKRHKGIIANPSAATIQLVVILAPIHRAAGIRRIIVSTYQAVSESGHRAVEELSEQIKDLFNFREPQVDVYPHQIAFNCLPQSDTCLSNGYTQEEMQICYETQHILEAPSIRMSATVVRVPVFYGHSETVHIETAQKLSVHEARRILDEAPGVVVEDDPDTYPMAVYAVGKDECFVGRIRADASHAHGMALWIVSDNLRKGSALNAVQIAEQLSIP